MDSRAAEMAIRRGVVVAVLSALLTLAVIIAGMASGRAVDPGDIVSPWNLIDVVLVIGLAFAMHRRLRTAAMALLAYTVLSRMAVVIATGSASGLPIALILIYFLARAAQGTFVLQRSRSPTGL